MSNLQDLQEKIFVNIKNLLSELSETESAEVLLCKEKEINQLYQEFSFLKITQDTALWSEKIISGEKIDETANHNHSHQEEIVSPEEIIQEEDVFANVPEVEEVHSFAEIDAEQDYDGDVVLEQNVADEISDNNVTPTVETNPETMDLPLEEKMLEEDSQVLEPMQDSQFSFAMEKEETILSEASLEVTESYLEVTSITEKSEEAIQNNDNDDHPDKKFKLAHIKGLKSIDSLFDEDLFEEQEKPITTQGSGSLLKNNVPTDYMEAAKPKPEFKLDLNDRIAFSQYLFGGSQSELNEVVNRLNSFSSVEKAQEFLSDMYYDKGWKKVDSYAQRLWTLVENRFL